MKETMLRDERETEQFNQITKARIYSHFYISPLLVQFSHLNSHPLEVESRDRDRKFHLGENYS